MKSHSEKSILWLSLIVTLFACLTSAPLMAKDDLEKKKDELSKMRIQLDETQKKVDSLRSAEADLVKTLEGLDEKIALDRQVITKVTAKLNELHKQQELVGKQLEFRKERLEGIRSGFLGQLSDIYVTQFSAKPPPDLLVEGFEPPSENAWKEVYFSHVSSFSTTTLENARDSAQKTAKQLSNVTQSAQQTEKIKKQRAATASIRETQKQSQERDLSKVRQDKESAADRLLFLTEAAKNMSDIVARLEAQVRESSGNTFQRTEYTGLFTSKKGRFKPPIEGRVVSGYGWKTDAVTNLKSFSPGIEIQGGANYNVRTIASGVVAYVGELRGYGNFVIVAHDDGYYSTYAGLDRVKVVMNQRIPEREAVGVTADGKTKFELRKGQDSVDPIEWLDFTSIK